MNGRTVHMSPAGRRIYALKAAALIEPLGHVAAELEPRTRLIVEAARDEIVNVVVALWMQMREDGELAP